MERFFPNLKMGRVWQRDYANHQEAVNDITDYIVNFYNSKRLHSTLGYLPPNTYEQQRAEKPPTLGVRKNLTTTFYIDQKLQFELNFCPIVDCPCFKENDSHPKRSTFRDSN